MNNQVILAMINKALELSRKHSVGLDKYHSLRDSMVSLVSALETEISLGEEGEKDG